MTLFKFYLNFAVFVELIIPFVPIFYGLKNWNKVSISLRLIFFFIFVEWLIHCYSFYLYNLGQNNLFLYYFHSFFSNIFILLSFYNFFISITEKRVIITLGILDNTILLFDFIYFKEYKNFNFLSGGLIDLVIFLLSTYYFATNFISVEKKNNPFYVESLLISLTISLQFFIKMIDVFVKFFLFDTQNHSILILQEEILYSYFMFFSILIYSYIFCKVKSYEQV